MISAKRVSLLGIIAASALGLLAFFWPFLADPQSLARSTGAATPMLFALVMGLVVIVVLAQMSQGVLNSRSIALLGLLVAVITALRPLGAGLAGIEPLWVVVIAGGWALGPAFGFALGSVSLFTSALVTAGVGPWLPFQMIAAGWIGLGAGIVGGCVPDRIARWALAAFGLCAAFAYGLIMNLWFWPAAINLPAQLAFDPLAGPMENLEQWWRFSVATSLGFDIPRALVTALLLAVLGPALIRLLRRGLVPASFHPAHVGSGN